MTFRDIDSGTAVASGFAPISNETLQIVISEPQCGGSTPEPGSDLLAGELQDDTVQLVTLSFDDGAQAALTREASAFVDGTCYEETGTWVGTAGSLDGQDGVYRWFEDTLQIELVLSDAT